MKKITLTESEFHSLIRRMVVETQRELRKEGKYGHYRGAEKDDAAHIRDLEMDMDYDADHTEMGEGFFGDISDKLSSLGEKFAKAVEMAKDEAMGFFEDMSPRDLSKIKMKLKDLNLAPVAEKVQSIDDEESELNESYFLNEGVMERVNRFLSRYGLGLSGTMGITGFLSFLAEIPGWIDFDFLRRVHEITDQVGLGIYKGPVSFLVFALGVIGAVWSLAARHEQRN